jgi:hypothetical protein
VIVVSENNRRMPCAVFLSSKRRRELARPSAAAWDGPAFNIRRCHAAVLQNGTVTLPMLREHVTAWVATERRSPAPLSGR